ncbi:tetratricopeptide repeat protein [Roseivirga pacifica]|uniref:tetratricopeptide repeat protein n=1 Tax=Roseivirga pacifica TaxID=1267423 RepID=UPI002095FFD3|nr:tetratricopeptide repeat protein [Roseivirga pacifica]MCO6360335.1 tetratricopeptide repeat protein [Roseivirga pacifica]MCO6368224.1 tetratricopeptide repeat protein [Roseivirga pacifica]MCO6372366.1 tetratricopeptide repeat protein [Roseivirga pacifica]MCO6376424.1 tetratricopeptide repeat protein [Roseivirga pacifica]MCO6378296.1 tetratricopeptide repeat protein [Roseivirga pacifica]
MKRTTLFTLFFLSSFVCFGQIKSNNVLIPTSSNSANTLSVQLRSFNELGTFYASTDPDSAFYYAKLALTEAEESGNQYDYAVAKRTIGQVFYLQGAYDNAIDYLSESLAVFRVLEHDSEIAKTMLLLGAAYQFHDLWEEALIEFHAAKTMFSALKDQVGLAETYGVIGHYYEKTAHYDSAFFYQQKALELYKSLDDSRGLAVIYDNIGSIYEDLEAFEQAYEYFMLSAKYDSISQNLPALVNTLNNLGDTYRKRGIVKEAVEYTYRALELADSLNLNYEILSAYHDLAKVYRANGREDLALLYYDSAYEFSQDLFNSQIAGQIANFQTLYETQEKEQEIVQLETDKKIGRQTRNSLLFGTVSFVFAASIIIYQERTKRIREKHFFEAEKSLDEEKIKNAELNRKALATELENKQLKEEQFHMELEARSQDLTAKTLHIIQKNRILRELKQQVEDLEKEKSKKKGIGKIINLIDENFKFDNDWEEFESRFDQVHAEFLDRLKCEFTTLTTAELRLASLIKMQLSSKDISTILGISPESLRISRYRLKKKLNLEKGQKLKAYLESF